MSGFVDSHPVSLGPPALSHREAHWDKYRLSEGNSIDKMDKRQPTPTKKPQSAHGVQRSLVSVLVLGYDRLGHPCARRADGHRR